MIAIFRRVLLTLSFFTVLMPSALALPAAAENVQFSCWCQNTTTRVCNHHHIDSGIAEDDPGWGTYGLALTTSPSILGVAAAVTLATQTTVDNLLSDTPALEARLSASEVRQACRDRCAADGEWRAIHFETTYREAVCRECNPAADSSCSESQSGRLAFGDQKVAEAIAQCEDRKAATSLLPVKLAVPIGGISEVQGLPDYINIAYRYMVTIVLVVAIVMVVYGGFRYLVGASIGDIQAGKKIIQDAIVGMLLVLGAYTILSTINPATTILSFKAPEPIDCQDLATPNVLKNASCSSDAECGGGGKRCVLAKNVVIDPGNVVDAAVAGEAEGRETGAAIDEAGGLGSYLGDGIAGTALLATMQAVGGPLGPAAFLAADHGVAAVGGYEVAGSKTGMDTGLAVGAGLEIYRSATNIHVCSTGEQGSPCAAETSARSAAVGGPIGGAIESEEADRYCRAGLTCVESWGMCWPDSGNGPGMPCDTDSNCSNDSCVDVEGTEFKVCEIQVRNSTPCFYPTGGSTVFPVQCNGASNPGAEYNCMTCPPPGGGTRTWTQLVPGEPSTGQCKPRTDLGASCAP